MIECVIFDCDGTLVDSEGLASIGLQIMLREYGIQRSAISLESQYKGWKLANVCASLESTHAIRLRDSFVTQYRALLHKLFDEKLQPIAGVAQALSKIDLPMCVASSGPPEKIEQTLGLTNLRHFFGDNIFSSYVVGSWKPEPGLFLHAAKTMGFAAHACAVVEDSEIGTQAALNAGMRPFWFTGGAVSDRSPEITYFSHMDELPDLLRRPDQ
ncbi:MAG TPA: HAD-IA family hydrolase [Rudaea sp.]|nr:HAD-IA family hydrolase [Rudaea sp.]